MEKLQDCRRMVERTRWIDARLMELRSGTERTTSVLRKTPRGTAESMFLEAQLDKITKFERYYSAQLIEALQMVIELDGWLRLLPRRREDVMRLRYVDARAWGEVAKELNYSEAHCYTLHHEAVSIFEKIEQTAEQDNENGNLLS